MFRTALIRTAAQASRVAARPAALRTAIAPAARAALPPAAAPRWAAVQTVRMYSAGGGLDKDNVEGRILTILQGFDKVSNDMLWRLFLEVVYWVVVIYSSGAGGRMSS